MKVKIPGARARDQPGSSTGQGRRPGKDGSASPGISSSTAQFPKFSAPWEWDKAVPDLPERDLPLLLELPNSGISRMSVPESQGILQEEKGLRVGSVVGERHHREGNI